ncbi:phage portal protein [Apilactobacillus xinyiensis]|uniref:phage portal protein n=1 Tax=Apilactobacillus xinyiensis TaxID=2841032 RepID=UPI001C7CD60D|nr:phage portal protein [Apilactobacillus xinyiensis]
MGVFDPNGFTFNRNNPNRFISGFLNQNGVNSPYLTDDIYFDDNDVLRCSPDFDIENNLGQVNQLLCGYAALVQVYHEKMQVYKGDHAVLHKRSFNKLMQKRETNMGINLPKNMVNTFAGFFAGIPAKINYVPSGQSVNSPLDDKSKAINDWLSNALNSSHYSDVLFELSKKADIYGRSYLIAYLDDKKDIKFNDVSPEQCLMVYDNKLASNPKFAIYFNQVGSNFFGTLYTADSIYNFSSEDLSDVSKMKNLKQPNPLETIPVAELPENDERLGMFDDAISAIDKLDRAYSLKFNDVEYFSNALLFLKGFKKLDSEQRKTIKRWHILQADDNASDLAGIDAKFLEKPQNDTQQEHFMDRVTSQIYQNAQIINLSDPQLGATASGDALGKKLQPMVMLADSKARKMTNAFKQLLSIMMTKCDCLDGMKAEDVVNDIQIKFTPNIPHSLLDESNIVKNLNGIVSLQTLLSYLSNVENVPQEMEQITAEKKANTIDFGNANGSNDGDYPTNNDDGSDSNNGRDNNE